MAVFFSLPKEGKILYERYNNKIQQIQSDIITQNQTMSLSVEHCREKWDTVKQEVHQICLTLSHCTILCLALGNAFSLWLMTGWPHFWETKFPEFSLRFPGHFKIFPWATQGRTIRWNAFLLAIVSHIFNFPWVFQVSSAKIQNSLSFPWDFDNISNSLSFPGLWPPCMKVCCFSPFSIT